MDSILIVSSSVKGTSFLTEFFGADSYSRIITVSSCTEAKRIISQNDVDLIVINSPLKDEFGSEFAISASEKTTAGVILIVKNTVFDEVLSKVESFGVAVVPKPVNKQFLYNSVRIVNSARKKIKNLTNENIKLYNKIEEIRLVDRAKCVLIQYLNMTEPQAHRFIEKQAMDIRITKKEVALGILKAYET